MNRPPKCVSCPFGGLTAGNRGPIDSPVCIVGESPGMRELREGVPFVGPSGDILWRALPSKILVDGKELSIPDDIFVTNALCCHPRKKEPSIMQTAVRACRARLLADVNAHPRKLIIALGNAAVWSLAGDSSYKITQCRGELIKGCADIAPTLGVLPVVHPAALMRGTGSYRQFVGDLRYATALLEDTHKAFETKVYYTTISTEAQAMKLRKRLLKLYYKAEDVGNKPVLAADIETTGLNKFQDELISLGVAYDPRHVYIIPRKFVTPKVFSRCITTGWSWCWHNGKFDAAFMHRLNVPVAVGEDTMLMSYTLDENGGVHGLETVASDYLRAPNYKKMLDPYLPNKKTSYAEIPLEVLYKYQALDVSLTLQVFQKLHTLIRKDENNTKLYYRTLLPASRLLLEVEKQGLLLDDQAVESNTVRLEVEMQNLRDEFASIAKQSVNLNSPSQLAPILYDKEHLNIRTRHRNTAEATLRLLKHPAVDILLKHRKVAKAYGTYVVGLKKHLDTDGYIRTNYNIHGTATGRLSSSDPNLQNIPRDPRIRNQFIAPEGYLFIEADLSQAELRSLAALSGDEALCDIYTATDRSLHKEVALKLFGKNYTPDEYIQAKAVNFGIVYGRQARSLADEHKITVKEGRRMITEWFNAFPKAARFIQKCRNAPLSGAVMTTTFGRRKRFAIVTSERLHNLQNEAANFPHQSIASDITLQSACRMILSNHPHRMPIILPRLGVHIVNLVHDSVLLLVPDNDEIIEQTKDIAVKCMESTAPLWGLTRVPFTAETKSGTKWGDLK